MAKVKSAGLRNYVGRLGGNVYYMNKGQNVSRELAAEVSNPRTPSQMRQRMKWANLVNVYKANKGWMGHLSFESKKSTWSDYNAFMSANIGSHPVYLTKQAVENGDCVLAPYTMTKGSLPRVDYAWNASVDGIVTGIKVSTVNTYSTVGDLSTDILENNPEWQMDDQLSFIIMYRGSAPYPIVCPIEIVLDTNDTTGLGEIATPYSDLDQMLGQSDNDMLTLDASTGTSFSRIAVCVVHSRTTNGRTTVSTQAFVLSPAAQTAFAQMGTDEQFIYAAGTYGLTAEYFLAVGYESQQGGGGSTQRILSFTGSYQIDDQGQISRFTITNGGQNTLEASVSEAIDTKTYIELGLKDNLVDDDEYCLAFIPSGQFQPTSESGAITSDGSKTLQLSITRTAALNWEGKAGTYYLVHNDAFDPMYIVASIAVTAV